MIQYKRPVKLTEDFLIIDADNKTLLPDIVWKPDLDHRARQRELGEWIVGHLNVEQGYPWPSPEAPPVAPGLLAAASNDNLPYILLLMGKSDARRYSVLSRRLSRFMEKMRVKYAEEVE